MVFNLNEIQVADDAERLIILRKRLNLSQFQFAKELEISTSYLGQVERGELPFSPHLLAKINNYLKREKELDEQDIFSHI
ncbi:XRE family transcriptional regulator [Neobacillus notoginsengisoli]|uniref:XRE family transcriptional regulator n=1 Tax=Neobacillus notoginsengisoli TaxID=1578198 RepID=A0A417YPQ5_9BACI|nr:helix-turn-helix transcriptional regulator [Neobacillus notoginsengisoli]RHW35984.1 XRE family transcriptional regulator [Neobacillus notoginsengisoli]